MKVRYRAIFLGKVLSEDTQELTGNVRIDQQSISDTMFNRLLPNGSKDRDGMDPLKLAAAGAATAWIEATIIHEVQS